LVSGLWEGILGSAQYEFIPSGTYFLLDIYRGYLYYLGLITILIGFLLLFRLNIAKFAALVLAWLNLFTAPLLETWSRIYSTEIKGFLLPDPGFMPVYIVIVLIVVTIIRLQIIHVLKTSLIGTVFFKKEMNKSGEARFNQTKRP